MEKFNILVKLIVSFLLFFN